MSRRHNWNGNNRKAPSGATLFGPPIERIGKLIRLVSSPEDHEALSAVRALDRLLKDHGGDFHHLADIVTSGWFDPKPIVVPIRPKKRPQWQMQAEALLQFADDPRIVWGSRESDFLHNMAKATFAPTAAQEKWMRDIAARIPRSRQA